MHLQAVVGFNIVYTGKWRFRSLGPVPAITYNRPFFSAGSHVYHVDTTPREDMVGTIYRWRFAIGPFEIRRCGRV